MNIEKTIIELEYLNAWRRDDTGKLEQPNATKVGETIDEAIKLLKQQLPLKMKENKPKSENHLRSLPYGTKVRINDSVECHAKFHEGGILLFQDKSTVELDENIFGILTKTGVCYEFSWQDYLIIEE